VATGGRNPIQMLADRVDQLRPRQTAGLDRFLNVLDFLRRERAPGQEFWCSVPHQHAAAPNGPPYHLKTVFSCPLLFRDKKNLQVGPSCSISSAKQTRRQSCLTRVCAKFIGEKPAGYQPAARCSQNSSQRPLSWEQRRAIIALAWLTVQRIPDCFSRCPMIVLQPASTTPEPTKRPWLRNWA